MPFVPLTALGTLVFTFINFLKSLTNKDISAAITQASAWLSGVVATVLAAHSDYAGAITFGGLSLDKVNGATQVFLGMIAASILGVVNEVKKAIDDDDSARQPKLVPGAPTGNES